MPDEAEVNLQTGTDGWARKTKTAAPERNHDQKTLLQLRKMPEEPVE